MSRLAQLAQEFPDERHALLERRRRALDAQPIGPRETDAPVALDHEDQRPCVERGLGAELQGREQRRLLASAGQAIVLLSGAAAFNVFSLAGGVAPVATS